MVPTSHTQITIPSVRPAKKSRQIQFGLVIYQLFVYPLTLSKKQMTNILNSSNIVHVSFLIYISELFRSVNDIEKFKSEAGGNF